MQIVQDLGGYSLGRADLVRRAMSKKKASVMEKERRNFVHGNPEEGVPGCISRGISEEVADRIFDEMSDFANYAFNKSHAAAYAVVSFQTAYLKYYHPVEFMAALMTSVIDNPDKCSEYILHCREMKIDILPPSVNFGRGPFTTEGNAIRYGMYAVKSVGRSVIDGIVEEREKHGNYTSLRDFLERTFGRDMNKRAIENLIKAGAFDGMDGTRRQLMQIYPILLDETARERKESMTGQMNLFDMLEPEQKQAYEIRMPEVGEYPKEEKLAFEKEVLGVYLSGHPLEEYEKTWRNGITAISTDFLPSEETGEPKVAGGAKEIIGGMITAKTIKYTKNNKVMAFLTVEDLVGTVEVLVFPKLYEQYSAKLTEDAKIFVEGHVSAEDDKASKLILDRMTEFSEVPRELWIAFGTKEEYQASENELLDLLQDSEGIDSVVIYIRNPKSMRKLPRNRNVRITGELLDTLRAVYGQDSVRVAEKSVEKIKGML